MQTEMNLTFIVVIKRRPILRERMHTSDGEMRSKMMSM